MQSFQRLDSDNIVPISTRYKRMAEAEQLVIERFRLEKNQALSDEEYVACAMDLQLKEAAWCQRWDIK